MINVGLKRLLLRARPQADESFMGFIVRLTELNDCDTPAWIFKAAGLNHKLIHTACSFAFGNSINFASLAQLIGIDAQRLTALTCPPTNKCESAFTSSIFGLAIPKYVVRIRYPKICPLCLLESPYCRRIWDVAPVTVCPVHKCMLVDECPKCGWRITWVRSKVFFCRCEYDWRSSSPLQTIESEMEVTKHIYRLCGCLTDTRVVNDTPNNNPLLQVNLDGFVSAIFFIAGQYEGIIDTKGKFLAPSRRNHEIHSLINRAFTVFEDWPNNYYAFLDWRRIHMSNPRYVGGLRKDFGEYKYALYNRFASTQLDFMRVAFEDYLAGHWNGGYVTSIKRHNSVEKRKYMSRSEAREHLRTDLEKIDQLIESGKLKAVVRKQGKQRLILIETTSVEDYKRSLEDLIGLKEAAMLLNVNVNQVLDLVKHDCLTPVRGPVIDGYKLWKFSYKEVGSLLHKVEESTTGITHYNGDSQIDLTMALRTLARCKGLGMGKFVGAILDKNICPCGKGGKNGLHAFLFSKTQVLNYLKNQHIGKNKELLLVSEVAEILVLDKNSTYRLIQRKIIPGQKSAGIEWSVLAVTKSSIDLFTSKYIFITKIANDLGTTPHRLVYLLGNKNILPVSGPNIDGVKKYLFRKSDLKSVDLAVMLAQAKDESRKTKLLQIQLHHKRQKLSGLVQPKENKPSSKKDTD